MKRGIPFWLAWALVAVYAVNAATGWIGGQAYARGRHLAATRQYEEALPYLERGAVGPKKSYAAWLRGRVRVGLWKERFKAGVPVDELDPLLLRAWTDYTAAIASSPAAGHHWSAFGDLYHRWEKNERDRHDFPLALLSEGEWAYVGRIGRIGVGLARTGIEREPTAYPFYDELADMLLEYRLDEPGLETVRTAAALQPILSMHDIGDLPVPPAIVDAFAEGSRRALGQTPLLRQGEHLLALAKVELRRGKFELAEQDLRAALALPGHASNRADGWFHLGRALFGQERYDEARQAFEESGSLPKFERSSLERLVLIARKTDNQQEALGLLRRLSRLHPRQLSYTLDFAKLAARLQQWDKAAYALKWARVVHPRSPLPLQALVVLYIEEGDVAAAQRTLKELEREFGEKIRTDRLRLRIQQAGAPSAPLAG